jgi:NAD(P)-dependent dehydrogenase (short-subunit alcohol dehydrogenase family)
MDVTEPADLLVDLEAGEVPVEALADIDVAYLASPEAGYVTGQEIVVAGGGHLLQVSLGSR